MSAVKVCVCLYSGIRNEINIIGIAKEDKIGMMISNVSYNFIVLSALIYEDSF